MNDSITVTEMITALKKRYLVMLIFLGVGLALAGFFSFFVFIPKYSSQAQLLVTEKKTEYGVSNNDMNTTLQRINTYADLIKGDLVMDEVHDQLIKKYKLRIPTDTLKESIKIENEEQSLLFTVRATTDSAIKSQRVANTTAQVFKDNTKEMINADNITITSNAEVQTKAVFPNHPLTLTIGAVMGVLIGIIVAIVLELNDRRVKSLKFVTEELGYVHLGSIAYIPEKEMKKMITAEKKVVSRSEKNKMSKKEAFNS